MTRKVQNHCVDVSVVVPVYNTANYVSRCIDSILRQNLDYYEIIVVDDCSNDNSYEIINDYSKKYEQVKVYKNNKNMGAGFTKNKALKLCTGKYICFLDSDDFLLDGSLYKLYQVAEETQCDDVFFQMLSVNENECMVEYDDKSIQIEQIYDKGILFFEKMLDERKVTVSACHHFLKREVLNDKIRFSEDSINDDWNFTAMLYNRIQKTVVIKNTLYIYFHRDTGSITKKADKTSLISEIYNHAIAIYNNFNQHDKASCIVREKCFKHMMIELQNEMMLKKEGWMEQREDVLIKINKNPEGQTLFEECKYLSQYGQVNTGVLQRIKDKEDIYIYGAGNYGRDVRRVIEANGINVKGFIVTHKDKDLDMDIPVFSVNEIYDTEKSFWVIAVSGKYKEEVRQTVIEKGILNFGRLID